MSEVIDHANQNASVEFRARKAIVPKWSPVVLINCPFWGNRAPSAKNLTFLMQQRIKRANRKRSSIAVDDLEDDERIG